MRACVFACYRKQLEEDGLMQIQCTVYVVRLSLIQRKVEYNVLTQLIADEINLEVYVISHTHTE